MSLGRTKMDENLRNSWELSGTRNSKLGTRNLFSQEFPMSDPLTKMNENFIRRLSPIAFDPCASVLIRVPKLFSQENP